MLTTVDRFKTQLGIDLDDTSEDDRIEMLIEMSSCAIETYCRRSFEHQEYQETFYGPRRRILLSGYPVDEVLKVLVDREECTDYRIEKERGILWLDRGNEVQVTYTAGYIMPGEPDRDCPADLEYACLLWGIQRYNTTEIVGIKSEQVEQLRVDYAPHGGQTVGSDLYPAPPAVLMILRMYRDTRR